MSRCVDIVAVERAGRTAKRLGNAALWRQCAREACRDGLCRSHLIARAWLEKQQAAH